MLGLSLPKSRPGGVDSAPILTAFRETANLNFVDLMLNAEIPQLGLIHLAGSIHHQVLGRGGLGKGHNVANILGPAQDHAGALDTRRKPAVRRCAVFESVEKKAEPLARLFRRHAESLEIQVLDLFLMDTDRSAGTFVAVDHGIVGLRPHLPEQMMLRIVIDRRPKQLEVLVHRRREGMMCRIVAVGLLIVLEHRELGHDQSLVAAAVDEILATCDLASESAESRCDDGLAACDDQDGVAFLGLQPSRQAQRSCLAKNLEQRRRGFIADLDPRESSGSVAFDEFLQLVGLLARVIRLAFDDDALDLAACSPRRIGEWCEVGVAKLFAEVQSSIPKPQIGLVRAITAHRLGVRHSRPFGRQIDIDQLEVRG